MIIGKVFDHIGFLVYQLCENEKYFNSKIFIYLINKVKVLLRYIPN